MNNRQVGTEYENIACQYLADNGYRIIERNFRNRQGEIDIIAMDESDVDHPICFIEVKYRNTVNCGYPSEAVDYKKRKTIINVARFYLIARGLSEWTACRFDVVAITPEYTVLYKNAFDSEGR